MVMLFIKAYWKQLVGSLIIVSSLFTIGLSIYDWGYSSCHKEWDTADIARDNIQVAQTLAITKLSESVVITANVLTKQGEDNLDKILGTVKDKPLYKIVGNKCTPSTDFERAYSGIIQEGNK